MGGIQTLADFRFDLLQELYKGHYQHVEDNFDFLMYGSDADPNFVYWDQHVAYLDYVLTNLESFFAAYHLLDDEASRDLFVRIMKFRCLGSPHFRIQDDFTWTLIKNSLDEALKFSVGRSSIPFDGMFGPLLHFASVPAENRVIDLDCWAGSVAGGLGFGKNRQYFLDRDGIRIQPERGDYVIDAGACFGDTGVFFACAVGPAGRVYSFDPLPIHMQIIERNIEQNNLQGKMFGVAKGVGDETNQIPTIDTSLAHVASPGFSLTRTSGGVPVTTIDDFVKSEEIDKIDFIKMDIEGFEMAALRGAEKTIQSFRPKLAVCLYHKPEDFYTIPFYLRANYPFYRFHLGHHSINQDETVLYAVADKVGTG